MSSQQMLLGAGKPPVKYYVDDVFSAHGWLGNSSTYPYTQTVNNGINLLDDGGLVWVKNRDGSYQNLWMSTNLGVGKDLTPTSAAAVNTGGSSRMAAYNNNGFRVGNDTTINNNGQKIMSWTFKKSKGFFDICEWSGNGTARTISHNLECLPGFIIIKSTTIGSNWVCWHRGMNKGIDNLDHWAYFNGNGATYTAAQMGYSSTSIITGISDTGFTIMADGDPDEGYGVNRSGQDYVAYVFAGGESNAATARSVNFPSGSRLSLPDHVYSGDPDDNGNWTFWSNPFTIEMWVKSPDAHAGYETLVSQWGSGERSWAVRYSSADVGSNWSFFYGTTGSNYFSIDGGAKIDDDQWHHIAVVRDSSKINLYTDGVLTGSATHSNAAFHNADFQLRIGSDGDGNNFTGKISNLRIIRNIAHYTGSFKVPTEPLTDTGRSGSNESGTVLLCCNNASVTGATHSSGETISSVNSPTASTDSPFDDSGGFVFGENEDAPVVKNGHYIGNGDGTNGLKVEVGFEPQFLMIKNMTASNTDWWVTFDTARHMDNEKMNNTHNSYQVRHNDSAAETEVDGINPLATGFHIQSNNDNVNKDGDNYIYLAIRTRDGYCAKQEAGTDIYAHDEGFAVAGQANNSHAPCYDSPFTPDVAWNKELFQSGTSTPQGSGTHLATRHFDGRGCNLHGSAGAADFVSASYAWTSARGFAYGFPNQQYFASMFKRCQGLDLVSYKGNGTAGRHIRHSLNKTPEMIITKNRDSTATARVWHKDLNGGGSNAVNYHLQLENVSDAQTSNNDIYGSSNSILPNSTHWVLGSNASVNENGSKHIAWAMASIPGVCKVGSYTGNGGTNEINVGFQPRFFLSRRIDTANNDWVWIDSYRGWVSGSDAWIPLNSTTAQQSDDYGGTLTTTGFTLNNTSSGTNANGGTYIYWCIA